MILLLLTLLVDNGVIIDGKVKAIDNTRYRVTLERPGKPDLWIQLVADTTMHYDGKRCDWRAIKKGQTVRAVVLRNRTVTHFGIYDKLLPPTEQ